MLARDGAAHFHAQREDRGAEGFGPVEFSRLVASGLGEGRDFASLLLRAARDAGMTIEAETAR